MISLPYAEQGTGTPLLMLHGWTDSQRSFEPVFPHARLTVYEGTGHAVHWEEPERFAADVAAFAAEVAS